MEQIFHKGKLMGIRIDSLKDGSSPVTNEKESVQLVTLKHKKGAYLKAHMHKPRVRTTKRLQECLIIRKGKIKIDLYDDKKKFYQSLFLQEGEAFLLLSGGYGIHVIKDAEIFEVKNGPFKEDKVLIDP